MILLVPADLEQSLDMEGLHSRCQALEGTLGYSLDSLIAALRPST